MGAFFDGITNGLRIGLAYNLMSSFMPYRFAFFGGFSSDAPVMMPGSGYNFFQMPDFTIQAPKFDFSYTQNYSLNNYSYNFIDFSNFSVPNNYYMPAAMNFTQTWTPSWNFNSVWNYAPANKSTQSVPERKSEPKILPTRTANELYGKWSKKDISKDAELTPEFCEKVIQISKNIKCDPEDLMAIMYHESRFSPKAKNEKNKGKNVGLIQFGAASREGYFPGKTAEETFEIMRNMSAIEQLNYVEKYFINSKKLSGFGNDEILTTDDIAALTFGSSIGKKEVLAMEGSLAYENNKALDKNGDKKITKAELGTRLKGIKA